jgi:hypothetical protein
MIGGMKLEIGKLLEVIFPSESSSAACARASFS